MEKLGGINYETGINGRTNHRDFESEKLNGMGETICGDLSSSRRFGQRNSGVVNDDVISKVISAHRIRGAYDGWMDKIMSEIISDDWRKYDK